MRTIARVIAREREQNAARGLDGLLEQLALERREH